MRVVGHVAGDDVGKQHDLGIGQQHAELGPGQRLAARLALGKGRRRRQRLDRAVEQAARFQRRHEAGLMRDVGKAALARRSKAPASAGSCWTAPAPPTSSVISASSLLRAGRVSEPLRMADASAILMLTSTSEQLTPPELSMASELQRAAIQAELDARPLRDAEIGALADHLGAHVERGDADGVIGAVADLGIGLGRGPRHRCRCRRTTADRPAP